jgi:hypothetical protein
MSKEVSKQEVIEEVVEVITPAEVAVVVEDVTEKVPFMKKHKWALIGSGVLAATAAIVGGLSYKSEKKIVVETADDAVVQTEENK